MEELERDLFLDVLALGEIDAAHAARTQKADEAIRSDCAAGRVLLGADRAQHQRPAEEIGVRRPGIGGQQRMNLLPELRVSGARVREIPGARFTVERHRTPEQLLKPHRTLGVHAPPSAFGSGCSAGPVSARCSQARANRQSSETVVCDTPSASAVSGMVKPPK